MGTPASACWRRAPRVLEVLDIDGAAGPTELRRSWRDGRVKLHVAAACLRARRGPGESLLAFARRATSAPGASYEGTVVPLPESVPRFLFDAVSGRRVAVVAVVAVHDEAVDVPDALAALPVTLLVAGPGDPN